MSNVVIPETFSLSHFEMFRSNVYHRVKSLGWNKFVENMLVEDVVTQCWEEGLYPYAFYLLATIDYLSKRHNIPIYTKYDEIRKYKMEETIWTKSMLILDTLHCREKESFLENAIPEFLKYNIVEGELDYD